MGTRRTTGVVVAAALLLSGCTVALPEVVEGSVVTVGVEGSFTSYNPATSYGSTPTNVAVAYMTGSGFTYYGDDLGLVRDTSFGSYQKLADDPLTVRYTVADGVPWSDGVAVDAADLLLAWVAESGAYDDPDFDARDHVDPDTGRFGEDYPEDVVYFDAGSDPDRPSGIALAGGLPAISEDRKSITLVYDRPYADWETAFLPLISPARPAHVVAARALGVEGAQEAKDALIAAIVDRDEAALAAISRFWNTGFDLTEMPEPDLLVSSGPYTVSDFVAGQYVTLTANEHYSGQRQPAFEELRLRTIGDPLAAVQALYAGEVQVVFPQPSVEVLDALGRLDVTVASGYDSSFEHLDLQLEQSRNGHFADPRIRAAFLKTVPRQQIVDELIAPLQEDARPRDSYLVAPGAEGYAETVEANGSAAYAEVDLEGARALLAEAGVDSVEVCILYGSADRRRVREFALIQQSAAQAGFVVTDCGRFDWRNGLGAPGAYDAALFGWQAVNLGVTGASAAYRTRGVDNVTGYSSAAVDALLAELDGTFVHHEQLAILRQVDELLWADAIGAPLYQFPAVVAFDHDRVADVSLSPLAPGVFWNVWDWTPVLDDAPH